MSLRAQLEANLDHLARWFERSRSTMVMVVDADDKLVDASREFTSRTGRHGPPGTIMLQDLVVLPDDGLLVSPRYGAPVQQLVEARGDGSWWLISAFAGSDRTRMIVGTLHHSAAGDAEIEESMLTAELTAYQRYLARENRVLETGRREAEQELSVDQLTGVASRRALGHRIGVELENSRRHSSPVCIIACDIDHFKLVNDMHGHAAGDEVLEAFGQVLRESSRPHDLPARRGGDEFTVLVPGADLDDALGAAERIRAAVAACHVPALGGSVTASFGVAQWRPGETVAEWERRADDALYRAKHGGRNRVQAAEGL